MLIVLFSSTRDPEMSNNFGLMFDRKLKLFKKRMLKFFTKLALIVIDL